MKMQVGTQFLETSDFDDMKEAAEATEMILAAHAVVNEAIGTGEYRPFVPANQEFISRRAQLAMLMEQMSSACDTLLVAKELFDRGDCDDALLGVIAYIGKIGKEMSTTVMKGWSTEQVHENSAELDRMTDRAKRGESFSGMAKVGVEIMAPMIHKSRQRQLTAALTAQLCERGCGDPECESCSGPSPADQPGDLVIPDDFESNGSDQ